MEEFTLQDPKAQEALERALGLLIRMNETGTLAFLEDAVELLPDSLSYLMDPRLLKIGANLAYLLHVIELLEPTLITVMMSRLVEELNRELTPERMKELPRVGPVSLLKAMSDPDVQRGLGIMLLFLRVLGRAFHRSSQELMGLMEQTEKTLTELRRQRAELERQALAAQTA
ncbi:DUF1641 domain-containing protein [Thermoflexus sp.]|uniref:DUF1641 domain-containing protein n=1 Tax=Thermoflexus sp. TaxID=1969742 RepID=UPI0025CC7EE2|nr:DUF1641 domain-containing protein [Thermoflexus sp.]MDW8180832.1 DUF1641 domain-containing protein [Anaerolineae bacterium]MCS6962898.1 DUF1641 domain-containing protein [Thermoflexus sp.]MCS7351376.1 DUF1641 domain-containing protein [Thermoflexus sp.]MCX7690129.1 DUF1641 domain-containing protein [Thermoflexus sp.]MDW8183924.1 DUF1641 domain-containing protein [Anaerolineae bacterium]